MAKTRLPFHMVVDGLISAISSARIAVGSSFNTIKSAQRPAVRDPVSRSIRKDRAPFVVKRGSASISEIA